MWFPLVVSNGAPSIHQGVVGKTTHGHEVTLPGDPCPWCRNTRYKVSQNDRVCSACLLNNYDATYYFKNKAQRDSNGSLLCMGCRDPFPYAETDENGRFRCYGCKSNDRVE